MQMGLPPKRIPAVLLSPDYEEEVHERPFTAEEIKNLLAKGYTLSIQGLGDFKMDFRPKATVIFERSWGLEQELRKIYERV